MNNIIGRTLNSTICSVNMKYLLIIAVCLLSGSCKSAQYQMKLYYIVNNSAGTARTINHTQHIAAANDSMAFVKATALFNQKIEENDKTKPQCDHFELYGPKGNLVKPK